MCMPEILIQVHDAEGPQGERQQTNCPHCGGPLDITAKTGTSSDDLWVDIAKARREDE